MRIHFLKKYHNKQDKKSVRQAALLNILPDIVMEVDMNKVYTWANEAGIEFFGKNVIGKEASYYFEGEQDTYKKVDLLFTGDMDKCYVESWQRRKDGQKRLLAWNCIAMKDQHGEFAGILSTAKDITEWHISEENLKASEKKFRDLLDQFPDSIVVHDGAKILYVNQAAVQNMGVNSVDDLIGRNAIDFVHPDYRPLAIKRMQDIFVKKEIGGLAHEKFINIEGMVIDVETFGIPFVYDGKPAIQLIIRNISERIRMEEARTEVEKKYKSLFEHANDAIFLMDEKVFLDCNTTTLTMFGCEKDQIIGCSPVQFSPELQPDGTPSAIKAEEKIKAAMQGQVQYFEWKHCRADGTPFDAEIMLNQINIGGKKYLQASVRDISQRKIADEKINAQLEELQRWQLVTIGREDRIRQMKQEVNELLVRLGEPIKYKSQEKEIADGN